jgi:regulatory protein
VRCWHDGESGAVLSERPMVADDRDHIPPGASIVTRIAPAPKQPGRSAIEIDGQPRIIIADDVLASFDLQVGDILLEARVTELATADEIARATEAALVFLAYRPRSEREVRDRLRRGSYGPEAIDAVIARLHDWHYLDDTDFARRWVENRSTHRPRGRRLLQQELRQKGIDAETVREVIAEADLDEVAAAEDLARRRLDATPAEDPVARRRRVSAFLARRGYGYDVIRIALERAMGPSDEDAEPLA